MIRIVLAIIGSLVIAYAISDHPFYGGEPGFGRGQLVIAIMGCLIALAGFSPKRIAERVILAVFSIALMLVLTELALEYAVAARYRPIYQADDKLIFKLIPNRSSLMTRSATNGGETVRHRINANGFRGEELKSPGSHARVVVYGDSFIHAPYTADKETFASVLGDLLTARTAGLVEVVNAGVSSYGPDQVSSKMELELPVLRPDLAVVAIFAGNDYGDLMRNKMFRLDASGALTENAWQLDPTVRMRFNLSQRESILIRTIRSTMASLRVKRPVKNGVVEESAITRASDWKFLLTQSDSEYKEYIVAKNNIVANTHTDYYSADLRLMPNGESGRYKANMMKAVMGRISDVSKANDVPLVFVMIPHPVDVIEAYDKWPAIDINKYPQFSPRNMITPLEEGAKSLGVPFVSLYDGFRAIDANGLYYHYDDDHWNSAGQRKAAEMTLEIATQKLNERRKGAVKSSR